jgi:hypothetical protein
MATGTKTSRLQSSVSDLPLPAHLQECCSQKLPSVQLLNGAPLTIGGHDVLLLHGSSDGSWTAKLAERISGERFESCNLHVSFADCNFARTANTLVDIRGNLQGRRLLLIVVSRVLLQEDYKAAEEMIELLNELAPTEGRVVTILKDNVTIPPVLRLHEWFDFRDEQHFEESVSDLVAFLRYDFTSAGKVSPRSADLQQASTNRSAPVEGLYSFGVSSTKERILSNLFPVVELPKCVYSAETRFQTESEVTEACATAGPLPFLLKDSRLYSTEPISRNSVFAPALGNGDIPRQENFAQWLSRDDRVRWAIELLNHLFRHHAWKRGLRWDETTDQYYFPRTKPKSLWWEISGRTMSREVTAPHVEYVELENGVRAEVQYGWRHQSIRADFVRALGNLFLRLEPSWLLTELDGKTPATTQPVGPLNSGPHHQERNGQILRSLRFWSTVLAKGHHEIRITTGQAPVRAKLTPLSGFTQFGIPGDQMDYDQLMLAGMEDDLLMPALGPLRQESLFNHEESIHSKTLRSSRNGQPQARVQLAPAGD